MQGQNAIMDFFRFIWYYLLVGFATFIEMLHSTIIYIIKLDFISAIPKLKEYIDVFTKISTAVLTLLLVAQLLFSMVNSKPVGAIMKNVFTAMLLITSVGWIFSSATSLQSGLIVEVEGLVIEQDMFSTVMNFAITDPNDASRIFTREEIEKLDINKHHDKEWYFWSKNVYDINLSFFAPLFITGGLFVGYLILGVKTAKNVFERTFMQIISVLVFLVHSVTGTSASEFFKSLMSNLLFLPLALLNLGMFTVVMQWMLTTVHQPVTLMVLVVAGTWFMLDGPEIVKRMFGVDVGYQDGARMLLGAAAVGHVAKKGLSAVASGVGQIGAAATGVAKGIEAGNKDYNDFKNNQSNEMASSKQSSNISNAVKDTTPETNNNQVSQALNQEQGQNKSENTLQPNRESAIQSSVGSSDNKSLNRSSSIENKLNKPSPTQPVSKGDNDKQANASSNITPNTSNGGVTNAVNEPNQQPISAPSNHIEEAITPSGESSSVEHAQAMSSTPGTSGTNYEEAMQTTQTAPIEPGVTISMQPKPYQGDETPSQIQAPRHEYGHSKNKMRRDKIQFRAAKVGEKMTRLSKAGKDKRIK